VTLSQLKTVTGPPYRIQRSLIIISYQSSGNDAWNSKTSFCNMVTYTWCQ